MVAAGAVAAAEPATAVAADAPAGGALAAGSGTGIGAGAGVGAGFGEGAGQASSGAVVTRPALIASRNPCLGFFPAGAQADHGKVQVQVHVDETGHASASAIVVEAPLGQDFGRAARACAAALRFAPARDSHGLAVAGDAKLELHFHRS
ncbi:MAG TPA: hypothetical protein VFX59_14630 [Polyangiales bacterium]|nr:hypothetical protein [Polyangiales bacterium]